MVRALLDAPLVSLAKYVNASEDDWPKFSDMGWQFLYYLVAWLSGMTLYYHSSWGYCPQVGILSGMLGGAVCGYDGLWQDMPHDYLSASFKWYYLLQVRWCSRSDDTHMYVPELDVYLAIDYKGLDACP